MSTIKTTYIQHPSAASPNLELAADGTVVLPLSDLEDLANVSGSPSDGQVLAYDSGSSAWNPTDGGVIIAVKDALFTGTQTNSTAGGANFAVTDLSITHTLADSSNKLIISAYFGAASHSNQRGQVGIAVADDGTLIGIGGAAGSRTRVAAGGQVSGNVGVVTMPSVTFVYEPGDTASHTYTVRAINITTGTYTIYINRSQGDANTQGDPRATSGFVIQEVKV